jgi:hypothetical protein
MPFILRGHSCEIRVSDEEGHTIKGVSGRRRYAEDEKLKRAIEIAQAMVSEENRREADGVLVTRSLFDRLMCFAVDDTEGNLTWLTTRKTQQGWILTGILYPAEVADPGAETLRRAISRSEAGSR